MNKNYIYLILSHDFGVCSSTTVHATESGAHRARAVLGGGFFVLSGLWDGEVRAGMKVRLGGVSTPDDDDFTSPTIRDESADESWGRIVEVLP